MTVLRVEIELTEKFLGTVPKDPFVWWNHVVRKAQEKGIPEDVVAAELGTLPLADYFKMKPHEREKYTKEVLTQAKERGTTTFHIDEDGKPFIYDYMVKGFLKNAAFRLKTFGAVKQLRSVVDNGVWVHPRTIALPKLATDEFQRLLVYSRPLRAFVPGHGYITSLVRSDFIWEGELLTFDLVYDDESKVTGKMLKALLDYGQNVGLGQWRNAGHGRFVVHSLKEVDAPLKSELKIPKVNAFVTLASLKESRPITVENPADDYQPEGTITTIQAEDHKDVLVKKAVGSMTVKNGLPASITVKDDEDDGDIITCRPKKPVLKESGNMVQD